MALSGLKKTILLILIGIALNCENTQQKKSKTKITTDLAVPIQTSKPKKDNPKTYPLLTDDNAMDFFLDYSKQHHENKVRITTDFGIIDLLLYDKTRFHRANFIYLTRRHYFNGTQFYRVVKDFVIQGGSSDDYEIAKRRRQIGKYLLPPDTKRGYTHKRGALSMPSSEIENAYKLASPYQFFIVQRKGGANYLDKDYTVFGEVVAGMDVVDKIAQVKTDEGEWPLENVYIQKVEIIE